MWDTENVFKFVPLSLNTVYLWSFQCCKMS